jgi:hypothetical protein
MNLAVLDSRAKRLANLGMCNHLSADPPRKPPVACRTAGAIVLAGVFLDKLDGCVVHKHNSMLALLRCQQLFSLPAEVNIQRAECRRC